MNKRKFFITNLCCADSLPAMQTCASLLKLPDLVDRRTVRRKSLGRLSYKHPEKKRFPTGKKTKWHRRFPGADNRTHFRQQECEQSRKRVRHLKKRSARAGHKVQKSSFCARNSRCPAKKNSGKAIIEGFEWRSGLKTSGCCPRESEHRSARRIVRQCDCDVQVL